MDSNRKQFVPVQLGHLLAHLEKEDRNQGKSEQSNNLVETEKTKLRLLRETREKILRHDRAKQVIQEIPGLCCTTAKPYLEDNATFFVAYLTIVVSGEAKDYGCKRIWRHLNECFHCFDIYTEVVRAFCENRK